MYCKFNLHKVDHLFQIRMKHFEKRSALIFFLLLLFGGFGNIVQGQTYTITGTYPNDIILASGNASGGWDINPCLSDVSPLDPKKKIFRTTCSGVGLFTVNKSGGGGEVFKITVKPDLLFNPTQTTFCVDGPIFPIDGYTVNPLGGLLVFSGAGVSGGTFYPSVSGIGTFIITATLSLIHISEPTRL